MSENEIRVFLTYKKDGVMVTPGEDHPWMIVIKAGTLEANSMTLDEYVEDIIKDIVTRDFADKDIEVGWSKTDPYPPKHLM